MGFSLRRLVKHAVDDINPFDGPAPVQQRPAAPPRPASTARPGLSVQPVRQQPLVTTPRPAVTQPLQVKVAAPQQLNVGNAVIAPSPTARTQTQERNDFLQKNLHPSLGQQVKTGLEEKLRVPLAAASQVRELGQDFVSRPAAQIAATVTNTPEIKPTNFINRQFIGEHPVKSIQQSATDAGKTNVQIPFTNTTIPKPLVQAGNIALNVAQDAPVVGGLLKGTAKVAPPVLHAVNDVRVPLGNNGLNEASIGAVGKDVNTAASARTKLVPQLSNEVAPATPSTLKPAFGVNSLPDTTPQLPITGAALQEAPLPIYNTKQVSNLDKAFRSTRSIIERQGDSGKQLANKLMGARDNQELTIRQWEKQLPTVSALARKDKNRVRAGGDFENFVEATQGKAKPNNDTVAKAVQEWQAFHPQVRERGVGAGLEIGDLGPQYYPHLNDYDQIFKDQNMYNKAINHLVESGQSPNVEEARKLLDYAKGVSRNREFGNLEASRVADLPFYDKSPNSLIGYLNGSAKRIAHTETFGAKDEEALKLLTKIGQEGGDHEAAKEAFDVAVGAKNYNPKFDKALGNVRKYTTTTRLGLGALTNASQSVNTGIVTGHLRTLASAVKQLDPKTREFARDTGVISDAVLSDMRAQQGYKSFTSKVLGNSINKITAPGFSAVEKFNRSLAATAGRDYALRLAQKGDEAALRKLGVTGAIKNNKLTEAQQIQAAREVVRKTQFKVDPQDLPGWTDSPGGKLVSQFRTFSYAQGKFFSNEILKPAAKGNLLPLSRMLAALPVGYGLYEARRKIDGRPEEDSNLKKGLASFGKIGGAGLVFDTYQSLNPPGSKYIPTDRRVSMAAGTFGGPTVGTAIQGVGAASELGQRKNTPEDETKLEGKLPLAKGDTYTDATSAARFGLQQIPIIGSPIKNRVLPYKKQSDAETGAKVADSKGASSSAVSLDALNSSKKKATADLKNSLSREDYKLSKLSKVDRQKLIDSGAYTEAKFSGLDNYVSGKKKELGITTDKSVGKVSSGISEHSAKVLKEYDNLDAKTKEKKIYGENDYEYKVLQAKYDNDLAEGKISKAQKVNRLQAVEKAKVGSKYSKDIRELHGLSRNELADLLESDPKGNKLAKQIIAYDQALTAKGAQAKDKFKNGVIARTGGSGGGRGGKSSKFATGLKAANDAATENQNALLKLVRGAKVSSKSGSGKKLNVTNVALKKQNIKKQKAKVA